MKEGGMKKKGLPNKTLRMLLALVIAVSISTWIGGCGPANMNIDKGQSDYIGCVSFSPDGNKIIFDRSNNAGNQSGIHVYDLETGDLAAYQSPEGERWGQARYSFDGKRITFLVMPVIGGKEDPALWQIAVMDADGKNVKRITSTTGYKMYPYLSHSGSKIIFVRADTIRTSGRTLAADYDVYEVEVETGRETRLTHFKFYEISAPYYFPDDKAFIFAGGPPRAYPAVPGSERNPTIMKKIREELHSKYQYNSIYVMQGNEKELKPYLVMPEYMKRYRSYSTGQERTTLPVLSADGSVLVFVSIGYWKDGSFAEGWQAYQYSADGNHRQITHLPLTSRWSQGVSFHGDLLAIAHGDERKNVISIFTVKDGTSRRITLPDRPSRIINSR